MKSKTRGTCEMHRCDALSRSAKRILNTLAVVTVTSFECRIVGHVSPSRQFTCFIELPIHPIQSYSVISGYK